MYDQFVDINKKFKASVNLEFDLQNEEKIEEYIPTTDLCDVIKKYIKAFLGTTNFKATTLAGPYGKGKSYLVLMILYLLSKRSNKVLFDKVCKKIKLIDNELYDLLIEINEKGYYLLPVIINNNAFSDLNKNFLAALSNSLSQFGFSDIVPNTSYAEAYSIINKWAKEKKNGFDIFDLCLKKLNLNLADIKIGLKHYDSLSFEQFTSLYSCVSHGLEFFSMKSEDIVSIYKDINYKITRKDPKCKGMFVVFDEFGAFLNNQTNDFVTRLNKIQAFAEMCNASDFDIQAHFCCITHKELLLYKKDKAYNDAFDTIAGRFESIRFDRSLDENYQIICSAIMKKDGYSNLVKSFIQDKAFLIKNILDSGIFTSEQLNYIVNNGYPFNPMSLFILIQVSEILAQNERTLFTFLSDTDVDGFRYFISNHEDDLLNIDSIYNYFESLIKDNEEFKMHYYKVESLKKISIKENERNIFKAIALIKIINDTLSLNCTIDNIAMTLGIKEEECRATINELIERKVLKKNINDDSIDFAIVADKQINKMISDTAELRYNNIDLGKLLSLYDNNKYEISNEYNFNHEMVRYYKVVYLEASKMAQLNSLNIVLETESVNEYFDGLIINMINDFKMTKEQVKQLLDNSEENIIVRYTSENIHKSVINKVKELSAAKYLCEDKKFLSDSAVKTLPLLVEDLTYEISTYLSDLYANSRPLNRVDYKERNLKALINKSFEKYYSLTISLNNEQVNKNEIQSVTAKARNNVIDSMMRQEDINFGKTSQEMTIYNSFINSNKDDIIDIIKNIICDSDGKKTCFKDIVSLMVKKPYGMRKGIIPLFVAQAITDLSIIDEQNVDTVILYNDNVEVDLNAINLSKACSNPDNYFYCYTKVNSEKIDMTYQLMDLFNCFRKTSFADNIKSLNQSIKTYVSNLSPIIVKSNKKDNLLQLSDVALKFKDIYLKINNNNYELLFMEMPALFGKKFVELYNCVKEVLDEYCNKIARLYSNILAQTKEKFGIFEGSLKSGVDSWMSKNSQITKIVFENQHKSIYNALKVLTFNDESAINTLSFGCVNCGLDDYNTNKYEEYFKILNSFIEKVTKYNARKATTKNEFERYNADNIKLSGLANTLYTNILESVEEYGDAISNEEKALIYKKLLNELLK